MGRSWKWWTWSPTETERNNIGQWSEGELEIEVVEAMSSLEMRRVRERVVCAKLCVDKVPDGDVVEALSGQGTQGLSSEIWKSSRIMRGEQETESGPQIV